MATRHEVHEALFKIRGILPQGWRWVRTDEFGLTEFWYETEDAEAAMFVEPYGLTAQVVPLGIKARSPHRNMSMLYEETISEYDLSTEPTFQEEQALALFHQATIDITRAFNKS